MGSRGFKDQKSSPRGQQSQLALGYSSSILGNNGLFSPFNQILENPAQEACTKIPSKRRFSYISSLSPFLIGRFGLLFLFSYYRKNLPPGSHKICEIERITNL